MRKGRMESTLLHPCSLCYRKWGAVHWAIWLPTGGSFGLLGLSRLSRIMGRACGQSLLTSLPLYPTIYQNSRLSFFTEYYRDRTR
ncbi:hypothetical protein C7212DRAFT_320511 [Tuber magnatum]|uniref:Uncharacterized protein n=1 Tax=Tuber magnatum TaxID=42249 RepID=A0A317SQU8_9PEZI|nr:hypothetical protein C7212DRAFT_320511 [Tuber magnatum]